MKTKKDLLEDIKILQHNLECVKVRENIIRLRLQQVVNYLQSTGKTTKEINKILKLDCEEG